ncbi:GNAT family N-acetyltransferase [Nocardia fusca]|uniref:GNAT family N-acetyltransferase n=1 Tax=Nocardia fusca TaxID=941183 RepID=UPI000AA5FAB7|nr:GNAT family N-acetyltransferase [Nocardia fusca]
MSGWSRAKAQLFQGVKNMADGLAHLHRKTNSDFSGRLRRAADEVSGAADEAAAKVAAHPSQLSGGVAAWPAGSTGPAEIRRLVPDEWRINRDIALTMADHDPLDFRSRRSDAEKKTEQEFRADFDRLESFVAFRDGRPVGRTRLLSGDDPRTPEMKAVWVSPDVRGAGIGDQLMAATLAWARDHDCSAVVLWVRENNEHAKNLYSRNGFHPTGAARPHFSDPGLRSIEMRNDLV